MRLFLPFALLCVVTWCPVADAQQPCSPPQGASGKALLLPQPTGPFAVGRTARRVTGTAASAVAAPEGEAVIHIWYPATRAGATPAHYIPGWDQARATMKEPAERLFREAYCAFDEGRITGHSIEGAPVARANRRFPLLLFTPGLGITSFAYSAQIEDLASHGYVVAAAEYQPAVSFVVLPDRWVATFDASRWNALSKLPEDSLELTKAEQTQIDSGAQSLRAALDEIMRRAAADPLLGRVDFSRVGVFGHSFGGMTVLRAVQIDPRFRAGLAQDALGQGVRAFAKEGTRHRGRFGLFFRPVRAGAQPDLDELFNALPKGTMLATASSPEFAHMSFSDLLFLRSSGDVEKQKRTLRHLEFVRALTRSYFDHALRGAGQQPSGLGARGYPELVVKTSGN